MTINQKVRQHVGLNPSMSNRAIADACGTTKMNVERIKSEMRKKNELPAFDPMTKRKLANGTTGPDNIIVGQNKANFSFKTGKRITSLQDLIEECEIDLNEWEIDRWLCNKWEVGTKNKQVDLTWKDGRADGSVKGDGTIFVEPLYQVKVWLKAKKGKTYEDLREDTIAEMKKHAPRYPSVKYRNPKDSHLLVIDPADIHIGKLCRAFETGEDHDNKIIVDRVHAGVDGILNKSRFHNLDQILFVVGNDILHVDSPRRETTSGTKQDTDGMWYENFLIAKKLYINIIEKLITISPVVVQYDPSNHDYINGFFLADTLSSWFSRSKNVQFKTSIAHRKYHVYHNNLIGTTHGDGAKEKDLGYLMAHEAAEHWAVCRHRYFYTHHLHHKVSKDYMSVCVETLRSPSGSDSWHHRNGYQHAPKAVEGFIHDKKHGQIARLTHIF